MDFLVSEMLSALVLPILTGFSIIFLNSLHRLHKANI